LRALPGKPANGFRLDGLNPGPFYAILFLVEDDSNGSFVTGGKSIIAAPDRLEARQRYGGFLF
jgi:hypothetical protein